MRRVFVAGIILMFTAICYKAVGYTHADQQATDPRETKVVELENQISELQCQLLESHHKIASLQSSQGLPLPASELPPGIYSTKYLGATVLAESTINDVKAFRYFLVPDDEEYRLFGHPTIVGKDPEKWDWDFAIEKVIVNPDTGAISHETKTPDDLDKIAMDHARNDPYGKSERLVIKTQDSHRIYDVDTLSG